ncbi:hypothetical protein GHK92_18145 [Nocardioides sp. dk4132]|uniref:hypothetical protein n=1 Tax=unclassified Nocardioides TaxID=2615069 RepID=UPI0012962208|nr:MULTISPECIES: hypothetical protein [unclassified Nocardioides]MQW77796.1 hypothetical protein [Nocardioides sp. dk4132]QGA08191.1 hypothetical protein GFH29_12850 [Nocardioides sp. dk884]
MTPLTDRLRRAMTLVLVVAGLVLGPQLAFATFGSSSAAPVMSVGTATMVAPSGVTGTYDCARWSIVRAPIVEVTGLADGGPDRTRSYVYTLSNVRNGQDEPTVVDTVTSRSLPSQRTPTTLRDPRGVGDPTPNDVWTLRITVKLDSGWESAPYIRQITCRTLVGSGNL